MSFRPKPTRQCPPAAGAGIAELIVTSSVKSEYRGSIFSFSFIILHFTSSFATSAVTNNFSPSTFTFCKCPEFLAK